MAHKRKQQQHGTGQTQNAQREVDINAKVRITLMDHGAGPRGLQGQCACDNLAACCF